MREQHGLTMEEQSKARFGNYELVRRIDVGGMGEVYLAHQRTAFGRLVAIKIIRSDLVHDLTARARFLREAEVSAYLKHGHILPLFEFGEDQGRLFLVTPYIEGGTLARHLESGPLPLTEVHQLFTPLVQAVAYIHRRGVVHRDLKPTNILLDEEDGQVYVRLIDFGIASVQGKAASPPLTTAGNEVGTIAYMAPERLSGIAAPSNDIFSLGIILYQMLTGHLPSSTTQHTTPLPGPLVQVIRRSIATRPEDRFATADELLKAFESAYQQVMAPSQPRQSQPPVLSPAPAVSRPLNVPPRGSDSDPAMVSLHNSGEMPALQAPPQPVGGHSRFDLADYSAPTTSFAPSKQPVRPPTSRPPLRPPPSQRTPRQRKRKGALFVTSALILIVLALLGAMLYYGYQTVSATSVAINFAPQTHVISQIFTLTASPTLQQVNVAGASIPARAFSENKQAQQTGATTGKVNCVAGVFFCQPGVSQADVDNLAAQMQQGLESQIRTDLQSKIAVAHGTPVSNINYMPVSATPNPQVGTASPTVTVTLVEQGSVGYVVDKDAESVARQLLTRQAQQFGSGFALVSSTVRIGRVVTQGVNLTSGQITLKISAGGVAEYQFPIAELQTMSNGLKGHSLADARAFLAAQIGVDPATIAIHFTAGSGNTLPGDPTHIKIIPLNPASLPDVPLPTVTPAPVATPSPPPAVPSPTATPAASPTPAD